MTKNIKIVILSQNSKIVIHRLNNRKNNIVFMRKMEGIKNC